MALDFYSQFSEFLGISYINLLEIKRHKESIPAINGQKEKIDIDFRPCCGSLLVLCQERKMDCFFYPDGTVNKAFSGYGAEYRLL